MKLFTENLLTNTQNEEIRKQIITNMSGIDQKWNRLHASVESRIVVSAEYLQFIKILNQFRSLALDLQELFKTVGSQATEAALCNNVLEQHVEEKLRNFERFYQELNRKGHHTIELLRKVSFILNNKNNNFE